MCRFDVDADEPRIITENTAPDPGLLCVLIAWIIGRAQLAQIGQMDRADVSHIGQSRT